MSAAESPPTGTADTRTWEQITADIEERDRTWRKEFSEPHAGDDQVLEWAAPVPFDDFDLPAFPVEALPPAVQPFVQELSIATQTPIDLPAMLAMSTLSSAVSKRAVARIKPGYKEPLNLYAAVVLGPGERKTAVLSETVEPLLSWERQAVEDSRGQIAREQQRFRISEKRLSDIEQKLARCQSKNEREPLEMEAEQLALEHAKLRVMQSPRLIIDDCTPEALTSLMNVHGGRIAHMSDEGGIFSILAGRYSEQPNLDVYLKAHSGSMIRVDRKGRESENILDPALTIGLSVQPGIINKLAETPAFRSTGLLARFLYAMPRGRIGYRDVDPKPMTNEARMKYTATVARMLEFKGSGSERIAELSFDTMAYQVWRTFSAWLEPQLQEFESLGAVRDWGSKLPGAVARMAGVFSLTEGRFDIDEATVERACAIGRYLVPHAIAAFSAMGLDDELEAAKTVLRLIRTKKLAEFTRRDLFRLHLRHRQKFKTVETIERPLEILVQRNYLRHVRHPSTNKGGRPSDKYEAHPHALR